MGFKVRDAEMPSSLQKVTSAPSSYLQPKIPILGVVHVLAFVVNWNRTGTGNIFICDDS